MQKRILAGIVTVMLVLCSILLSGCTQTAEREPVNEEPVYEEPVETQPVLSEVELAAQEVIGVLQANMKNPSSLQVHTVEYCDIQAHKSLFDIGLLARFYPGTAGKYLDGKYFFIVDASAENSFGGMHRETYYLPYGSSYSTKSALDNSMQEPLALADGDMTLAGKESLDVSRLGF